VAVRTLAALRVAAMSTLQIAGQPGTGDVELSMKVSRSTIMFIRCIASCMAPLTALALATGAAQADIYKWVDHDGAVTYSDAPPKGKERVVEVFPAHQPTPEENAAAASRSAAELRSLAEQVERLTANLAEERRALDAERAAARQQYVPVGEASASADCNPNLFDCEWVGPTFYPPTFYFPGPISHFKHHFRRHDHEFRHDGHKFRHRNITSHPEVRRDFKIRGGFGRTDWKRRSR
jgi:hypothetical protein